MLARYGASPGSRTPLASLEDWRIAAMLVRHGAYSLNRTGALCVFSAALIPTELSRHDREPRGRTGFFLVPGQAVTVSLAPDGGEGRNRTGSAALAGRARCLTCHPQGRRALIPLR